MKAIWSGSIGFGLVNIPIKIFSAIESSDINLDMLDKKDFSNIRFKRVNEQTGKEVAWENIVKGYKMDDKYIVVTDEDFAKASPEKSKTIEISAFVNEKDIDNIYYEIPYYTVPEKNGAKAYCLLRDALKKSGKAGLGSFVLRSKESLCILKVLKEVIVLNKIRYAEEIRDTSELNIPTSKSKPAELKMADQLIDHLTKPFNIEKYKDTYSGELMKLIKAKAKGKKIATPKMKVVHSTAKDLMSQLKASLGTKEKRKVS